MTEPAAVRARPPLDSASIARGAGAALLIAIPAGVAQRIAGPDSGSSGLLFVAVLAGFAWGGAVAGKANPDRYLTQASAAALAAVLVYLAIGLVDRRAGGRSISVVAIAFTALLAVSSGIVGAELGERRRHRAAASDDDREGQDETGA